MNPMPPGAALRLSGEKAVHALGIAGTQFAGLMASQYGSMVKRMNGGRTAPDDRDMKMILDDIAALRRQVDVVMVAFHWGVDWVPRIVSDYQVTAAHACIEAGADLIMGHHPHVPKGIEVYQGKVIFYCLGTLCMTSPLGPMAEWREPAWIHGALRNHADLDPDYPLMPYGRDSSKALMAKAILTKRGVKHVSFLPMKIDKWYRPEVLRNGDPRFDDVVRYLEWASDGFDHRFTVVGDEVVVAGRSRAHPSGTPGEPLI